MSIFNTRSFIIGISIATVALSGCDRDTEEPRDVVLVPVPGGTEVAEIAEMQEVAEPGEVAENPEGVEVFGFEADDELIVGIDSDTNEVVSIDEVEDGVDRVEIVSVADANENERAANEDERAVIAYERARNENERAVNEDELAVNEDEVPAADTRERDATNDIWAPDTQELSDASPEDAEQLEPFASVDTNEDTAIARMPAGVDEPMPPRVDEPTPARVAEPMPAAYEVDEPDNTPNLLAPYGMAFSVGGSLNDFTDGGARDFTAVGGGWEARYILGTRTRFAGEAAYIGTANGIDALGVRDNAVLMSNGLEGLLRLNILTAAWQPYVAAGVGWKRYNVVNTDVNTSDIRDQDDALIVPLAAGLAYRFSNVFADVRMNVKPSFMTDITSTGDDNDVALHSYGGQLSVGFEF